MSVLEAESTSSKENQNPMLQEGQKDLIFRDEAIIDMEIQEIETEMSRLFTKLESMKLEKQRINETRKQSKNSKLGLLQKIQDLKPQHQQQRRGVSLCPAEIYSTAKSSQAASKGDVSNNGVTVSEKQSSRRQSCFWKLGEIDELKVTKERGSGNGSSISPKPVRKAAPVVDDATKKTKAVTTKKVSSSVQPKRLFRDTERSLASKKPPVQSCRAAIRYNHNSQSSCVDGVGKLQSLSLGGTESGGRVKKRWEIPAKGEVVVYKSCDRESTPVIDEIANDVLPKIRTLKCVAEKSNV